MKIYICAPSYSPDSGGIIVLHKLCDILLNLGYDAYLYPTVGEYYSCNIDYKHKLANGSPTDKDIVIYPEIIEGNPLRAKNIVRYILNFARPQLKQFEETDYWLYYSDRFYQNEKPKNILHIIDPKLNKFINYNVERKYNSCFTLRKKEQDPNIIFIHDQDSIYIGHNIPDNTLISIFNQCKKFYSYDTETFLSVQAALCGCESIIVPYPGLSKQDIINKQPVFEYAIKYGEDDIPKGNEYTLRDKLFYLQEQNLFDVKREIEKIKIYFNL